MRRLTNRFPHAGRHARLTASLAAGLLALLAPAVGARVAETDGSGASAAIRAGGSTAPVRLHRETLAGTLGQRVADSADGSHAQTVLHSSEGPVPVRFSDPAMASSHLGRLVQATGFRRDGGFVVESLQDLATVASAPEVENPTTGERRTLLVLVNFQDDPSEPWTPDEARAVLATTGLFFGENSGDRIDLSGDVFGWHTLPIDGAPCDSPKIAAISNGAEQAALDAGLDPGSYAYIAYAFPPSACPWWGLSSIGGNPGRSWINGGLSLRILVHEAGHALGLYHSQSLDCGSETLAQACVTRDLGDVLDVMGDPHTAHLNPFQKERLGWLEPERIVEVTDDTTVDLVPYESETSTGPQVLKIPSGIESGTGARTWYYLEYRQPIGFDAFLEQNENVKRGVVVRTASESGGDTSHLLDMNPGTPSRDDPALGVGEQFFDPAAGVRLTVLSADAAAASIRVGLEDPVTPGLDVALTDVLPVYGPRERLRIDAVVSDAGAPVVGALVMFELARPDGRLIRRLRKSRAEGAALFKYRIRRRGSLGIYVLKATVLLPDGRTAVSTASFRVEASP